MAEELTAAQQTTLDQFRKELYEEDILHDGDTIGTDDATLLRFLRARKFSLPQAKKMFKDCQHWRSTVEGVGIDQLYREMDPMDRASILRERRSSIAGRFGFIIRISFRKLGRPLNIHFFGNMNLPKLYKDCTPQRHWRSVVVNGESLTREILPAASRKAGKPIRSVLVLVDLKGFGLSQFWQMKSLARDSFQMSQDYYPETMGSLFIINAPSSFAFIYSVLKPWMAPETQAKVSILGSDYKSVLLEHIDKKALPKYLGGECTCDEFKDELDELGVDPSLRCRYSAAGPWGEGREGWGPRSQRKKGEAQSEDKAKQESAEGNADEKNTEGNADDASKARDTTPEESDRLPN